MKFGNVALVLALGWGSSPAQELVDPFGETITPEQEAIKAAPDTWEVMGEVFSLPFGEAVKLQREVRDPGKRYAALLKRVDGNRAILEELVILKGLVYQKTETKSVEEYIYPTAHDPPEVPLKVAQLPDDPELAKLFMTPSTPTAFDLTDLGITLELAIEGKETPSSIRAEVNFTLTSLAKSDQWGRDKAVVVMPRFAVQSIKRSLTLAAGRPVLVGTMSPPKSPDGEPRVWFLFATVTAGEE